jgi:eukaryotic-like serine/threonine-protein kinase
MNVLKSNLQLGAPIANGYFGDVHLARDDVHGEVAVKVLRSTPGESAVDWAARKKGLLQEAQRLNQAAHANVVRVHYLLESDSEDAILLVMEACLGGSLQAAFDAGPMPLSDVLRISTEVCLGLNTIHARGMLHRDIKPGNILLSAANVAQIGDFGLVTDNLILGYGSQAGYSDHISPEVWNGAGTSVKSDVWALGMTIYRLLHGAQWYSRFSTDPRDVIRYGGFGASLPWLPHIPDKWRRAIRKMMHDETQKRYQTANQVMTALAALSCEPDWKCAVTANEIRWEREAKGRRVIVRWTRHSPRRHEWSAWSEPLGAGNRRSLGGSGGTLSYSESERQLKEFFAQ